MAYAQSASEGKTRLEMMRETARDFGLFLYNKEKGEVMGRDGKSWAKITVFFLIFYSCLAGFFAAMLAAFMSTVPALKDGPKLTQYLAGKQGLISVPTEIEEDFASKRSDYEEKIKKFLKPYKEQQTVNNSDFDDEFCDERDVKKLVSGKQCRFNLTALGPCYGDNYGYKEGELCIFVRMNKVFNWVPEPNDGIKFGVELDCYKEGKKDGSNVKVYPEKTPGFPINYYPYKTQHPWLAPVAAVHVTEAKGGDVILCEANAKNIEKSETFRISRGAHGKTRIDIGK